MLGKYSVQIFYGYFKNGIASIVCFWRKLESRIPVVRQGFMFGAHTTGYSIGEINRNPENMEALIQTAREFGTEERLKTM